MSEPADPGASNFLRVRAFHERLDGSAPPVPVVPDRATLTLRATLLREESAEVLDALERLAERGDDASLAAFAYELADLLYVAYGSFVACGIDGDAVFEAVHAANMRKLRGPRRADGKQLKPHGWKAADVAGVIVALRGAAPRAE